MSLNNFVVALATLGLTVIYCTNVIYAYSSTYSDEPPAVNDSGGNNDDNGSHIIPQVNLHYAQLQQSQYKHQNQQQQHLKYPDQNPYLTYFTTSKINSTLTSQSSLSSLTSTSLTPTAISTKQFLQSPHIYKAEAPTHIEPKVNKIINASLAAGTPMSSLSSSYKNNAAITSNNSTEQDGDLSKKIIGSSVVTSVSVILNGDEPEFTDALGHKVPKPQPSLQVASPIDLLNPDRYEFFTFDEHGELIKRLMSIEEIQSIVANDDGEGPTVIHHGFTENRDPEKNVQDIVNSVQKVLNKEVETNKNTSTDSSPVLDTPDVSSSWSMILPAIFGNTGDVEIFPQQKLQQIVMTPDTEIIETSTEEPVSTTIKKSKPSKKKPTQKRKPTTTRTTTETTPQVIQEELDSQESVYTGIQQYQHLAATIQNYDGFSQLQMQPIYHKLPEQEVVFSDNLAKKPVSVQHKPTPPHRVKKPNGGHTTTKRPQTNKDKIKKKPTTTAVAPTATTSTATITTTPVPTTTSNTTTQIPTTTTIPSSSTTTTTVTLSPTASTTVPATTTTSNITTIKISKKKKKRPTRQPVQSSGPHANVDYQKPHLVAEKRKPSTQQHSKYPQIISSSDLAAEGSGHQVVSYNKYQHVLYHKHSPKPNKPTISTITTSITTTTTTSTTPAPESSTIIVVSPSPTTSITNNPPVESLITQNFPGYEETFNIYGEPLIMTRVTTKIPEIATSVNIPFTSGTSGYPVPSHDIKTEGSQNVAFDQLKKQPLPSYALTQPYEQDKHTLQSFDQIMQTLKEPDNVDKMSEDLLMVSDKPSLNPVEYDHITNKDSLEEITNKLMVSLQNNKMKEPYSEEITSNGEENFQKEDATQMQYQNTTEKFVDVTTNMSNKKDNDKNIETTELPSYTLYTDIITELTADTEIPESTSINKNEIKYTAEHSTQKNETLTYDTTLKLSQPTFTYGFGDEYTTEEYQRNEDSSELLKIETRLPVSVQNTVETIKHSEKDTNHPILVADLKPHLNLEVIKPSEQISMSDFQTLAATVASTLVDNSINETTDYSMMNSNDTKYELAFLISDVIKQISNSDDISKVQTTNPNDNRYSNQAQLDISFLMKPTKKVSFDGIRNMQPLSLQSENANEGSTSQYLMTQIPETSTLVENQQEHFTINSLEKATDYNETFPRENKDETTTNSYINTANDLITTTLKGFLDPVEELLTMHPKENTYMEYGTKINNLSSKDKVVKKNENETDDDIASITSPIGNYNASHISTVSSNKIIELKVPIPSLSKIYAQQQNLNDEREALFEAHSAIDSTTIINNFSTKSFSITETPNNIQSQETEDIDTNKSSKNEHNKDNINKIHELKSEPTTVKESPSDDVQLITEAFIETSEEEKMDPSKIKTAAIIVKSSEETMVTQTTESTILESLISRETNKSTIIDNIEENTTFIDLTTSIKENYTNEYGVLDSLDVTTTKISSTETESNEDTSHELQRNKVNLETTTTVYQMSGETSAELNAMISEEDETNEAIDEDPYIKLGETTEKPKISSESTIDKMTQSVVNKNNIAETNVSETNLSTEQTVAYLKPINLTEENRILMNTQSTILMGNYGQPYEIADEEDEDDQIDYQITKLSVPATIITIFTTTPTTRTTNTTTTTKPKITTTRRLNTLKPVSYFNKQPTYALYHKPVEPLYNKQSVQSTFTHQKENPPSKVVTYNIASLQQRPMQRPPQLSNLMITSTQVTRPPVKLDPSPNSSKGLEASLANLDEDILTFAKLCNELAFEYWKCITSEKISSARSLVISPFALTSMLSMVFLGARGSTSGEMNDMLKLDDMITFNPHLVFRNITDSVEKAMDSNIATTAFVREIFSDRANGKILQFFKEKTQQIYAGHVEEVNFHVVNDIIRRRTNLLVKRHTMGKVLEYLRTNSVWVNGPLATISANLFQTDCSHGSTQDRDGELFFQVHPTVRQRRLIPIPAVLFKSGFTAGYEPNLDATVVAFGRIQDTTSMIYVMPGHLSSISPSDNLYRLEKELMGAAISKNAWSNILTSLMNRPGMEVQLPKFSHRSFINGTLGLQKMGIKGLFKSDYADLGGLTGSSNRDIYLSDMIQINTFSTCGEEKIGDHHHIEMYPAPPIRKRNKDVDAHDDDQLDSSETIIDFGSLVQDSVLGRGFYDDLLDPKYLELPLPLRPRQARVPDAPRLKFDKPFLYFVRHNPTGMILFMGRFNPRLLP